MWGSVVVSLLFWGFANDITTVDEAKKYYPLFGLMANVALIFSGQYVKYVSGLRTGLPLGADVWGNSLKLLMAAVVGGGAVIMGLMAFMQSQVRFYMIMIYSIMILMMNMILMMMMMMSDEE